ncbi:ATP-binding cassette domain-containing protein [Bradyrhizobium jicamae]|uniref:ATP-binding cassette domain-containing protein n=1 Tax=Bradyrhizobium jicamae TaxID=280332 RepID=A0ABS5FXA1_9BRAD|nr:ABC transporter ATP-binding protein [Bradyrhizobium jicamae]MBR0801189.1 ATP-binding cassette domain-containing protein [Bradyrhizobium jicamae]
MTLASIKAKGVSKVFALAEQGAGPVSLVAALRAGEPEIRMREVRALDGVSFEIAEGERIGIIGPNGAGKTTLLSILAGVTSATAGTVEVSGELHAMLSIGAVLRDDLTGRENVDLDASIHGRNRSQTENIEEKIIEFSELGDFIDRPVRTYSSGMKARLAFSMGAFIDPDILIIDETLSVGDFFFAQKASQKMREIAAKGRIVIIVAHSMGSVVEMCSRCLWLDHGRIVMDGDPKSVTTAYEQSVRDSDEAVLARKFEQGGKTGRKDGRDRGKLGGIRLIQEEQDQRATLAAMRPLQVKVTGSLIRPRGRSRLSFSILRVDGRLVWLHDSIEAGMELPTEGAFEVGLVMDPFILGADLYRLDVGLTDDTGEIDRLTRVFEVVDLEGQFGGKPLLFYPPQISGRATGRTDR